MKEKIHRALAVLGAICILLAIPACNDVDPNVSADDTVDARPTEFVVVTETESELQNEEKTVCVGGGRYKPQTVDGVTVDVGEMAVRSYELCFLLGQENFTKPSKIPVDAAVQYAFCLIYYDGLWQMPTTGDIYRTASVDVIERKLEELFGKNEFKVKESPLYSKSLGMFEMFQPKYGRNVYYNVDSAEASGENGEFVIYTSFFSDEKKSELLGRTVLTVGIENGHAVISALKSEY